MDSLMLRRRAINLNLDAYIDFADPVVAEICIDAWGDGTGLTRRAAMFITNSQFGVTFKNNTEIVTFNELKFFVGLTALQRSAFEGCTNLSSITLPSSIKDLSGWAFSGCSSLENINLDTITKIDASDFMNCVSLSLEINMPNLNNLAGYQAFQGSGITKIKSLGSITGLGGYMSFADCSSLSEVVLPQTLTSMSRQQFQNSQNLVSVICLPTTPPSVAGQNFRNCGEAKIYVPYSADHSILTAYQTSWGANAGANQYDVPRLSELEENGNIPE